MDSISEKLFGKLKNACDKCSSETISLSGGLDSTILAYYLQKQKPKAISIIAKDFEANDLVYCQMASQEFDLPLTIYNVETEQILEAVEETIKILKNFNDIEIRNNIVMYLAIKWAKDNQSDGIITGDGADELFAGYNFLLDKSKQELEGEIQRIYSIMHFPTQKIGKYLGLKVESPFLDEDVVDFALSIPGNLKVDTRDGKKYGKWILRKTFEGKIPEKILWREKSPMQDGAGTNKLGDLFENMISDSKFDEKRKTIQQSHGITIRTKESMYYFDIFRKLHGIHQTVDEEINSCPYCHFNTENSKFCRMCGAFPI
ncbi:MAG: asparagine synthase [Nitrosopumilaceae archaeon]|uniref:Asparagine synthase n=1 Tax=Candidatus Nitrosomaritimum aestuariumsis TaxID=3342354 RepID=A0AC60W686_9ARCH|nr:asparagine synthase [Nitrosopumilaceae archaeon]